MSIIFESTIQVDEAGEWVIKLQDTLDGEIEVCKTMDDYFQKVEELGAKYGGHVDEVKWRKDENVPPHFMDEIRLAMAKQQAEIEEKIGESILKQD